MRATHPLKAAAGTFSNPQHIEDNKFEWVSVSTKHRLRSGMFVAQVVGQSWNLLSQTGLLSFCRAGFRYTPGKTVLVQLRDRTDPKPANAIRLSAMREKVKDGTSGAIHRIFSSLSIRSFQSIEITGMEEGDLQVVAELSRLWGASARGVNRHEARNRCQAKLALLKRKKRQEGSVEWTKPVPLFFRFWSPVDLGVGGVLS